MHAFILRIECLRPRDARGIKTPPGGGFAALSIIHKITRTKEIKQRKAREMEKKTHNTITKAVAVLSMAILIFAGTASAGQCAIRTRTNYYQFGTVTCYTTIYVCKGACEQVHWYEPKEVDEQAGSGDDYHNCHSDRECCKNSGAAIGSTKTLTCNDQQPRTRDIDEPQSCSCSACAVQTNSTICATRRVT